MKILTLIQVMIASLIFFPARDYTQLPSAYRLAYEEVRCQAADGTQLYGWFMPAAESRATIYFLHGNAGNISDRLYKTEGWVKRGYSVFLLDYRSYGQSKGSITSENDIYQDAEAGLAWLRNEKKTALSDLIIYGESIGSAPALYLAVKRNFKALILESPFTSLADVAKIHYPFVPSFLLRQFQFNNLERLRQIHTPVIILHGIQDGICPYRMGETLFREAPQPKELVSVPEGRHNDLYELLGADFFDKPIRFMVQSAGSSS
ncbi:MAG: alpha/beta hydrolase [Candidatus Omnitrophica bacterium CG11_big_fil_rev_8_21_14_0_20_45_26]|uniref:Alpha/beta hydrolase n=1 Tax=Candidatus Abzuiibacterium crystallinum TaxID=1974748 RepID=A0A2H0LRE7_9BACT|nr:MAG: alpha/beta hydrolase [Candidatus Omnitrophica bacterium CG11_big_fil_rev_8_21_14_0_20_45_26]PIW64586.1 MAG: alpha/beta hydrolase [Candidatus Omnitrophica bacterium CG12_big_fil_rev_8_21_14_0_65_45_16]